MKRRVSVLLLPMLLIAISAGWGADLDRVRTLLEEGRPSAALSNLEAHLAENPVDPEALFLRGLVLAESQREGEALAVFEDVTGLRPDRPEPLNNLAVIQAAMGDYDAAVETLKDALRTHPAYRTVYENLTKIYGQLASEAYSRALSVEGAQERSSLELVLLSDMILADAGEQALAQVPREPLPSGGAMDSDEASMEVPGEGESASEEEVVASAGAGDPATPDAAIEQALSQGREDEDMPAGQAPAAPVEIAEEDAIEDSSESTPEELAAFVEAWAKAWSEKRVDDYLYFYGSQFRPEGDLSRDDWRQIRRDRIATPQFIRVSIAFLDFETEAEERARVRFNQSYESDTFSDVVTKTLDLVREDDAWKIVRESVDP